MTHNEQGIEVINASFEPVYPGIEVARGACTEIAGALHDQLSASVDLPWSSVIDGRNMLRYYRDTPLAGHIEAQAPDMHRFRNDPLFVGRAGEIVINHYPPGTAQLFHDDDGWIPPVDVVQLSPGGYFDYLSDAGKEELEVEAGDIVRLQDIWISHRGRTKSEYER